MTTVSLSDQEISFAALSDLCWANDLTTLSLTNVTITGGEDDAFSFSKTMRGNDSLESLTLINVEVPDADFDTAVSMALVSATSLKLLHIEITEKVSVHALLSTAYATSLETLKLPKNDFEDVVATTIAAAISASSSLKTVDLSYNDISDKGCDAIASALEKNSDVETVLLEGNGLISSNKLQTITKLTEPRGGRAIAA